MAQQIRIELNDAGIQALLKGAEVFDDVSRRAGAIAAAAGEGVVAEVSVGRDRARAFIYTQTYEAARNEAESQTLTRALDAGRA